MLAVIEPLWEVQPRAAENIFRHLNRQGMSDERRELLDRFSPPTSPLSPYSGNSPNYADGFARGERLLRRGLPGSFFGAAEPPEALRGFLFFPASFAALVLPAERLPS